jgi:AcrR family transcriptional regulator
MDAIVGTRTRKTQRGRGRPKIDPAADDDCRRTRLLDEAERLFASHGFHGVTVRDITRAADCDVALAAYYFGTKRGLFDAAFLRRAEILNADRIAALDAALAEAAPAPASPEAIIAAFINPVLARSASGEPGWKSYLALVAQVNNTPEWGGETMARFYDPTVHRFIAALRAALAGCDDVDLFWSYHALSGALTLTLAETGRIDRLSGGLCRSNDYAAVMARLPRFLAAGFLEMCAKR